MSGPTPLFPLSLHDTPVGAGMADRPRSAGHSPRIEADLWRPCAELGSMRVRAPLIAALVAALISLTACADPRAAGGAPPPTQRDNPERGGDRGGGGMM